MAQLIHLRNKIESIKTTKKITHAIRLVSMSSYSKLEKQVNFLNYYKNSISKIFSQIISNNQEWSNKFLFPNDILDKKPLFIFISSGKGLCGSFNSNLIRYIDRTLILDKEQNSNFILIGQKIKKEIEEKKIGRTILSYDELNSGNIEIIAKEITQHIYEQKKPYSSVSIYSNSFQNFFIQRPHKTTLIPAITNFNENTQNSLNNDFLYEQNINVITDFVANKYIKSVIMEALFQSLIAENAARFLAMDSSNTNAEKLLDKLILQFNKSRQALITREVSELSANME